MVSAVEQVPVRVSDRSDDLISEPSSFIFRSLSKEIYNTVHNNQEPVEEEYFCPNLDTDLHHEMAALRKALNQISEKLECLSQGGSAPSRGRPVSRFQETSINFDALVDRIVKRTINMLLISCNKNLNAEINTNWWKLWIVYRDVPLN